ncbi:MAG: hypothetical protein U0174_26045 [Polyangiaceae bacterium]
MSEGAGNRLPGWVKVSGIIAVVFALFFLLHLVMGGSRMHAPTEHAPTPSVTGAGGQT